MQTARAPLEQTGDSDFCPSNSSEEVDNSPDTMRSVTTLMFRRVPRKHTSGTLLHEVGRFVDLGVVDFVYLPWTNRANNMGFGFVNFATPEIAHSVLQKMQGKRWALIESTKCIRIIPAVVQGLIANLVQCEHRLMTGSLSLAGVRPLVFLGGKEVDYREALMILCGGKRPSIKGGFEGEKFDEDEFFEGGPPPKPLVSDGSPTSPALLRDLARQDTARLAMEISGGPCKGASLQYPAHPSVAAAAPEGSPARSLAHAGSSSNSSTTANDAPSGGGADSASTEPAFSTWSASTEEVCCSEMTLRVPAPVLPPWLLFQTAAYQQASEDVRRPLVELASLLRISHAGL